MNRWIPSFLLFICLFVWLDGFILPVFAQQTDKEPAENQTETEKPEKPKSAVEKYREFYDPKNYTENYKERYKGENYRTYYRQRRYDIAKTRSKGVWIKEQTNAPINDMIKDNRLGKTSTDNRYKFDQYGNKTNPASYSNNSSDANQTPPPYYYGSNYDPYLYDNTGGVSLYGNPGIWIPNPYEATLNGQWQDNPLTKSLFSRNGHKSGLPKTNTINLPEPMPSGETNSSGKPTGFNPFLTNPAMVPPHLIAPASPEITQPTTSSPDMPSLPKVDSTQEKPAELLNTATSSIKASTTIPAKPVPQQPSQQLPIQKPYVPPPTSANLSPAQMVYNQGLQSFAQRNYPKAKQLFEKMATANPGSPYAQYGYGLSLFYTADYEKSYKAFEQSANLSAQRRQTPPNLWQMQTQPTDFRYHFKKLTQYVEQNPKEKEARDLLFYLSRISSKPPSEAQQ